MNMNFLKDRYKEWSDSYEFDHPGTPCGNELLAKSGQSKLLGDGGAVREDREKRKRWQLEEKYGSAFLMYTEAGFYAGYELACYMLRSMLVDDLTPPAPGEDHERA